MAKINPTLIGAKLFGKKNGQNISITRNGSVIRNTTQPTKTATPLQSKIRFGTSIIANKFNLLSSGQLATWEATKHNYSFKNSAGANIPRTAQGVFNFVNQNLKILNKNMLLSAPTYEAMQKPVITNESSNNGEFVIKGTNLNSDYSYVVFCEIHNSLGQRSLTPEPIICSILSYAELLGGKDILPDIKNKIQTPDFKYNCTISICAINSITGNRDMECIKLQQKINPFGLNLNILSYYQFNDNVNDYFGVNNGVNYGATFNNYGVINKAIDFTTGSNLYFLIPNSPSLNFTETVNSRPFTFLAWLQFKSLGSQTICDKRGGVTAGSFGSFEFQLRTGYMAGLVYDNRIFRYTRYINNHVMAINTNYFVAFTFDGIDTVSVYVNGILSGVRIIGPDFNKIKNNTYDVTVGKLSVNNTQNFDGYLSEFTIVNDCMSVEQINTVMNANLNGQTILDIN